MTEKYFGTENISHVHSELPPIIHVHNKVPFADYATAVSEIGKKMMKKIYIPDASLIC